MHDPPCEQVLGRPVVVVGTLPRDGRLCHCHLFGSWLSVSAGFSRHHRCAAAFWSSSLSTLWGV